MQHKARIKTDLLLVGGGHAMLPVIAQGEAFLEAGVEVTLINAGRYLMYSGMTPEFLGGYYALDDARIDLQALCEANNISFVDDSVTEIDPDQKIASAASGRTAHFNWMAIDIGGETQVPDVEVEDHKVLPVKPLQNLVALEGWLESQREKTGKPESLVIVGGGAAGVELSLNIAARMRTVNTGGQEVLRISLIQNRERLLPQFPPNLGKRAQKMLRQNGVTIHLNTQITGVNSNEVVFSSGDNIAANRILWATGTKAPSLFQKSGFELDSDGFLQVNDFLQSNTYPWLFSGGDCVTLESRTHLKKIGVHAVKQGPVLAKNLLAAMRGKEKRMQRFRPYPVTPVIISTGTSKAWLTTESTWWEGAWCRALKHRIDQKWVKQYQVPGN